MRETLLRSGPPLGEPEVVPEAEYVKAGLALIGAVAGSLITAFVGYLIARQRNITDMKLRQISEQSEFNELHIKALESAHKTIANVMDEVDDLRVKVKSYFDTTVSLGLQKTTLEAMLANCEKRVELLQLQLDEVEKKTENGTTV